MLELLLMTRKKTRELFLGEISSADFIKSAELSSLCGFSSGQVIWPDPGCIILNDSLNYKTLYFPKAPIRTSWSGVNISKTNLINANLVYGNKTIDISGKSFIVRLLKGSDDATFTGIGGEYKRLILPLVREHTGDPSSPYTVSTLGLTDHKGITCVETGYLGSNEFTTLSRTYFNQIENVNIYRWRPVLELVE